MYRLFTLFLLSLAFAFPLSINRADSPVSFDTAEVDLWPEYDQPNMLVIYHLFINANTPLPATLTLHIPARVGDPAHVATREADGLLYNTPFTRTVSGDWSAVTFTAASREVQFEYYDPALTKDGVNRSFTYEWQGEYSVNSLSFQVQQPVGAAAMKITPSLGIGEQGNGGITYYQSVWGSVTAGDKFSLSLQYQKFTDTLTSAGMQVQPAASISSQTAGRAPGLNYVIAWTLGGLGAILLVSGGVWYWRSARAGSANHGYRQRRQNPQVVFAGKSNQTEKSSPEGAYCHQCGHRAREGDIFCRVCGTRLRKDEA